MVVKQIIVNAVVPHSGNDYTPSLLQRAALLLMLCLVLLTFLVANMQALLWQGSDWLVGAVLPGVVVEYTNTERADIALPALVRNPVLDEAARLKAEHMAEQGYFAHYSPDGVSPWVWFGEVGYRYVHAGENLAVHFSDSEEVVDAWMKSPTHRANIVNGNYREIGVGTAKGTYQGYPTVFVVQLFGTPAIAPATTTAAAVPPPAIVVAPEPVVVAQSEEMVPLQAEAVAGVETSQWSPAEVDTAVETVPSPVVSDTPIAVQAEPLVVEETAIQEDVVSVYSGTIATSTNLIPALVPADTSVSTGGRWATLATSPRQVLQSLYLLVGSLLAGILLVSVVLEWRQQRPRHVLYGVGLLILMAVLFWVHTLVTAGAVVPG